MASITAPSSAATFPILLSVAILVLVIPPSFSALLSNVLSIGDALASGNSMGNGEYNFTMEHDCNLVLYKGQVPIWSSHTSGMGSNCFLVLQSDGELFINTASGFTVWKSETGGYHGHYILVMLPNGDVVVYGRSIWSTGTRQCFVPFTFPIRHQPPTTFSTHPSCP